jgi:hypothetical protein
MSEEKYPEIPDWARSDIDLNRASPARIYDYLLGGYHNFEIDRETIEKSILVNPNVRPAAIANRSFLRRAVNFLLDQGIDQFLDIGTGIPTVGNVHEIVQGTNPEAHVVYVDIDPVAVAHSRTILQGNPRVIAIQGDARKPKELLENPELQALLDFSRSIGVLFVAVLHFVPEDDLAYNSVYTMRDALPSGSYIVISHSTYENAPPDVYEKIVKIGNQASLAFKHRTLPEMKRFFEGLELVDPGVVHVPLWRPETPDDTFLNEPERAVNYGGVGRKP